MLISWEKRAGLHGGDGSKEGADVFQTLLGDFWEGIGLLLVGFVDTEEADQKALEGVATLLQASSESGTNSFSIPRISDVQSLKSFQNMTCGVAFVQVMRYPDKVTGRKQGHKKKSVKICLSEPGDVDRDVAERGGRDEPPEGEARQTSAVVGSLESERLEEVVCQLAQLCLVYVNEKQSERHLVFLSLLLRSFHTPRVFTVSPSFLLHF